MNTHRNLHPKNETRSDLHSTYPLTDPHVHRRLHSESACFRVTMPMERNDVTTPHRFICQCQSQEHDQIWITCCTTTSKSYPVATNVTLTESFKCRCKEHTFSEGNQSGLVLMTIADKIDFCESDTDIELHVQIAIPPRATTHIRN